MAYLKSPYKDPTVSLKNAMQVMADQNVTYELYDTNKHNDIICYAGSSEMLRVGPDGFWVRGVKVEQDAGEEDAVYRAFKEWMTWAQLTRP